MSHDWPQDILNGENRSLIVGPLGSGRTKLICDMARRLAETRSVFVDDTLNKFSGNIDGAAPEAVSHDCDSGRVKIMP